ITTILEMPNCNPTIYNADRLRDLVDCVTPKAYVDFGIWGLCLGDLNLAELAPMAQAGAIGFKFFWGYAIDSKNYQLIYNYKAGEENVIPPPDQTQIYKMFRELAKIGKPVGIHAENFDIIRLLTQEVTASGDRSYEAMLRSRPPISETTVIETAISFAKELGTRLHILHLAAGDGVELIRRAKGEGVRVTAETAPHYLTLTDRDAPRLGAVIKAYPPVRRERDSEMLWDALNEGVISFVASDHAPHTAEEKAKGLWDAPAGISGIETMSSLLMDAVNKGKMTINRLADVLSEQPARLYGLYPRKGSLTVGADADIVIADMNFEYTFHQEDMHSRVKLSPYDGRELKGKPVQTILRGRTVMRDGEIIGAPVGRFVRPE
ncbi:MAG: amidohydrolase family protein, partial [Angelakisella sp.]